MNKKKYALVLTLISILIIGVTFAIPKGLHPDTISNPKFVLAGWSYPDEYGQGIGAIRVYENYTGDWEDYWGWTDYYDPTTFEINASSAIRFKLLCAFNATLTGAVSVEDGKNYLQHSVTVTDSSDTVVFTQQNFTYIEGVDEGEGGIYDYEYQVDLNFITEHGQIYTAIVTYEVYYESLGEYGDSYLHDCSDTSDMTYDSNSGLDPSDYGIGSNGSVVEIWIVPDSVADEKVLYKLDFPNFNNTDGDINLTVRYRVEDGFIGFRLDLYYTDASYDSTGLRTSQTWANLTIDADVDKTLDYALLVCDDYPSSVTSGNRSIYVDFVEITSSDSLVFLFDQWNLVSTATLIFSVSLDYWGLNMSLVFGGLILMLLSACIVAKKVRDRNITNDAGILLLFLFCVGWGLFIGGTIIG